MAIVDTDWESLFCGVDDFCQAFIPAMHARLLADGTRQRNRQPARPRRDAGQGGVWQIGGRALRRVRPKR